MNDVAVEISKLYKQFNGTVAAVSDLNLTTYAGEILALLGPSGCGKTTALRLVAGFEHPDSGLIKINDEIMAAEGVFFPPEKRGVGMVFQEYALFPHLTVSENISFGLHKHTEKDKKTSVTTMLELVGLPEMGNRYPHELSGGQRQRIALARAMAPKPFLLLLDEPFSNLDADLRVQMREDVRVILKGLNTTAIFVTHDQEEALFMGDRVAVLNHGQVEQIGTPEEIFHAPETRFVAEFLGGSDFLPGTISSTGIETEVGLIEQPVNLPVGTQVEIVVRADDVTFKPARNGKSLVLARNFLGVHNQYRLCLPSGYLLHALGPHTNQILPGTPVEVKIAPDHPLMVFPVADLSNS